MSARIFDKYEVVRRVAVGGMGEVFLAKQVGVKGFERPVILKAVLAGEKAPQQRVTRFLDEARLVATLNHPNVVSVFEAGQWNGTFFLAMEYIAGWNLAQLAREVESLGVPLPIGLAVRVIHDAALGLDHAHHATDAAGRAQQIVHRDVSPHNIMVRRDGHTKVVDFGVAWALNRDSKTQTGSVVGKMAYMAPEQLRGQLTDGRTDQFALGVVLWELLTGRRLYQGSNDAEIAQAVLTARIVHPSEVVPAVPRELGDVAMRMLAESSQRRFARCLDVATELMAVAQRLSLDWATASIEQFLAPMLPVPAERESNASADFFVELKGDGSLKDLALRAARSPAPDEAVTASQSSSSLPERPATKPRRRVGLWVALAVASFALGTAAFGLRNGTRFATGAEAPSAASRELPPEGNEPSVAAASPTMLPPTSESPAGPSPVVMAPSGTPREPTPAPVPAQKTRPSTKKSANKPVVERHSTEAVPARRGFLTLATVPWSKVTIDGRSVGSTPLNRVELAAGPHDLLMENPEEQLQKRQRIVVAEEQNLKLEINLGE